MLNLPCNLKRHSQLAFALAGLVAILLGANLAAAPKKLAPKAAPKAAPFAIPNEPFLGSANAPVTLIEYGSMTCVHCAAFSRFEFDEIKARYIDTGKVKFIFRTLPTPPYELSVAMQVISDCAGPKRFDTIKAYFQMHEAIMDAAEKPRPILPKLLEVSRYSGGLSDETAKQCLANNQNTARINNIAGLGFERYKLESTPSFIVNDRLIAAPIQGHTAATISAAIDSALARRAAPPPKAKRR